MSAGPLSRRELLAAASVASLALGSASAAIDGGVAAPELDLSTPAAQLRAFLKLNVSLVAETVYYLYEGTLEAALPGRGMVPLMASTSIVRRQVEPQRDGHLVSIWEATVYHRAGLQEPLESFVSPLNGRTVRPFHQREGRSQILWTETGPMIVRGGERLALNRSGAPFSFAWERGGGRVWISRQSSGSYGKHSLDPAVWPLEYSGPELLYSEKTTNSGLASELADARVMNASSTYSLNQIMLWWPWLLMGQTPGFLIWNTQGVKFSGPASIPMDSRRLVESIHPTIFAPGAPWEGQVSLWTEYPKQRRPERV